MPVLPGVAQAKPFFAYKYRDQLKVGRFYNEKDPEDAKEAKEIVQKKAKGIIKRREKKKLERWVTGNGAFNPESMIESTTPAVATVEERLKESEPVPVPVADVMEFPVVEEQPINSLLESKGNYFKRLAALKQTNPEEYARIRAENQAKAKATREKKVQKRMKSEKVKKVKPLPPTPEKKKAKPLPQIPVKKKLMEELKEKLSVDKKIKKLMEETKGKDPEVLLNELDAMANKKLEKNNKNIDDLEKILDVRDKIKKSKKTKTKPKTKEKTKANGKRKGRGNPEALRKYREGLKAKKQMKAIEAEESLKKLEKNTKSNLKGNVFEK